MIRYKLSKPLKWFKIHKINSNNWSEKYSSDIESLIKYFNQEYNWDGMFGINDVKVRLDNGDTLFILYQNNFPIGYVFFKELDVNTTFLYNLYITNVVQRSKFASIHFINNVCEEMLYKYDNIELECEDWHESAQKLFETIDFIKKND